MLLKSITKLLPVLILASVLLSCKSTPVVIRKPNSPAYVPKPNKDPIPDPMPAPTPKEEEIDITDNSMPATLEIQINEVIDVAESYIGTKHRMGGLSKKGIDCSGLVLLSYKSIDIQLPRSTRDQVKMGDKISKAHLRKGDLVFFTYPGGKRITHVGMIHEINGDSITFIHTSSSKGVRIDELNSNYWKPLLVESRRVL